MLCSIKTRHLNNKQEKMKPMDQSYQIFVLLCICSPNANPTKSMQIRNVIFAVITFVYQLLGLISSCVYIVRYFTTNLANTLCAGYQMSGLLSILYTLSIAYIWRGKIQAIFDDFQIFCDKSEYVFSIN